MAAKQSSISLALAGESEGDSMLVEDAAINYMSLPLSILAVRRLVERPTWQYYAGLMLCVVFMMLLLCTGPTPVQSGSVISISVISLG